ncbi:potassium transporter [Trichodelitschia bisporula]|uniref:Potassium transporter n=1 Tax=Trichodelitschia bisporula TaxID=703511 RepID=A0A6G1I9X1_9PEZI|nr:potassium transporter [Trichodelitschia bisporula]
MDDEIETRNEHIKIVDAAKVTTGRKLGPDFSRLTLRKTLSRDRESRGDTESAYEDNFDTPREGDFRRKQEYKGWPLLLLAYQSAGVIYGDIGTSPLYVFSSTFNENPPYEDLVGALSMIIWTLTIIVTIKYVTIVLNADNEGQGGTFAMYTLLTRFSHIGTSQDPSKEYMIKIERFSSNDMRPPNKSVRSFLERRSMARRFLSVVAVFGVSLIMSDGVITPAQSILGAVQGLRVVKPELATSTVIAITCALLVVLFAIQPIGVSKIGGAFAPIIIVWLLFNFSFGVFNLVKHDHSVLRAFSPYFAGLYFVRNKSKAWRSLGGILLSFTGVEALFADLGAFSKRAIQISWCCLAYPCILMAYIGQAAYISRNPSAYSNPFFNAVPHGLFWPAFIVSILASIVASQALITSTFQLLFQVINTSYFPPISFRYTSRTHHSQVFIPMANWLLMIGTIVVTAVFKDTTKLGNAYGVCVILDTVITTTFVSLVALIAWRIKWYFVLPLWLILSTFEGLYLTSALTKVPDGAWFTIGLAVILASIFCLWRYGKEQQWKIERNSRLTRLSRLLSQSPSGGLHLTARYGGGSITPMKGFGIFFDKTGGEAVPVVYQEFLSKFEAQPQVQVFLHLKALTIPHVAPEDRYAVTRTNLPHCYRMIVRYGYGESPLTHHLGRIVYDEVRRYILANFAPRAAPLPGRVIDVEKRDENQSGVHEPVDDRLGECNRDGEVLVGLPVEAEHESQGERDSKSDPPASLSASQPASRSDAPDGFRTALPAGRDQAGFPAGDAGPRLAALDAAYRAQTVYIVGKPHFQLSRAYNLLKRGLLWGFLWIRESTAERVTTMGISVDKLVECGFIREI